MNDNITLPRSVVEHVMYHLNRGDADAVCWADGVIKPALEQPPGCYDQQALDLCSTCGWKTLIPGDCCLNCARQQSPALQQPQGEMDPVVATVSIEVTGSTTKVDIEWGDLLPQLPAGSYALYTYPQHQRKPLTRERIKAIQNELSDTVGCSYETMARAVERAHNIGSKA